MDPLTRIAMEHGQFYEALAVFKQALSLQQEENCTDIDKLSKFFNDLIVPHFQFEEARLFPLMFDRGTSEEKRLTEELKKEHLAILKNIDEISNAVQTREVMAKYKDDQFIAMLHGTIKAMLDHARKEDSSFYPNIRKYLLNK